jgi:hypothetical protein
VTLSDQARPVDFLENHIAKTDEVYGLGLALLDPGADAKIILDEYIAKEII